MNSSRTTTKIPSHGTPTTTLALFDQETPIAHHASRSQRHQAIHRDLQTQRRFLYVLSSPSLPLPQRRPSLERKRKGKVRKRKGKGLTNDETAARIKRNRKSQQIKFKVRCHRFLYTLVLKDSDKADKLKQSLPPGMFLFFLGFRLWQPKHGSIGDVGWKGRGRSYLEQLWGACEWEEWTSGVFFFSLLEDLRWSKNVCKGEPC